MMLLIWYSGRGRTIRWKRDQCLLGAGDGKRVTTQGQERMVRSISDSVKWLQTDAFVKC